LVTADAGFQAEGIISMDFNYQRAEIPRERRMEMMRLIGERLGATPGVVSAAGVGWTPVSGSGWDNNVGPDGVPAANSGKESLFNRAGPGYFATMGTALLAGREFNERDTTKSPKVAIVNEIFARKYYNDSVHIVGRTFRMEDGAGKPEPLIEIVGVVKNTKYYELREDFRPQAFFPLAQEEEPGPGANFVARVSTGSVAQLTNAIKREAAAINPLMGIEFRSFSVQLEESLLRDRLMATLSSVFAGLAVVLSSIGLYGVISYMVARRRNEIGIRIALGAGRGRVIGLVLRETVLLVGFGVAVGLVLSYWTGQGAATLLYGVKPFDPATLAASVAFLLLTALLASYAPARRATNLEPMAALREE
jgi:predicted permease